MEPDDLSPFPRKRLFVSLGSLRPLSLQDQAAKDKALQSMATMSSAQIISPTAFQNKMALQGLSRPAYPTAGGVSPLPTVPLLHHSVLINSQS